jgi:hypothetical protein
MVSIPINNFRAVAFRIQSLLHQCSNFQLSLTQFSHGYSLSIVLLETQIAHFQALTHGKTDVAQKS